MTDQIFIGSLLILVSLFLGAVLWFALNEILESREDWLRRPPRPFKMLAIMGLVVLCTVAMMTVGVWLWAVVFMWLGIFGTLEEAVYYSLVAYTTLGLGDVIVPFEWRLLGGMTGANGFLMFGMMTAVLTDSLRHIRRVQHNLPD